MNSFLLNKKTIAQWLTCWLLAGGAFGQTLTLYYDFEEGSGITVTNRGVLGGTGTLFGVGANGAWESGAPGSFSSSGGLGFDGTNVVAEMDHISTGYLPSQLGMDNEGYTVAAWVKVDNVDGNNMVLGQDGTGFVHLGTRNSTIYFGHFGADSRCFFAVEPDTWYHIVWLYIDGAHFVYVNGERCSGPIDRRLFNNTSLILVGRVNTDGDAFDGVLDDLAIYDSGLFENQIAYLAAGGDPRSIPARSDPPPEFDYVTAPFGPGGSWNLYALVGHDRGARLSWYNAYLDSLDLTDPLGGTGKPGHLAWVESLAESHFIRNLASREAVWIGLTDNETFGGSEAGSDPAGSWVWVGNGVDTPPAFSFELFGEGEPNDAGGPGEDAVLVRADGEWNDNQSGIPGSGQSAPTRRYMIEWEIQSPDPVPGARVLAPLFPAEPLSGLEGSHGTWGITEIQSNGTYNLIEQAIDSVMSGTGLRVTGESRTVNFYDPDEYGSAGIFQLNQPILSDTPVAEDHVAMLAKSRVFIEEAGLFTFGLRATDGVAFRMPGVEWMKVEDVLHLDPMSLDTVFVSPFTQAANGRAQAYIERGYYNLEFVAYEHVDSLYWEIFSAFGQFEDHDDTDTWRLVGHNPGDDAMNPYIFSVSNAGWRVTMSPPGGSNVGSIAAAENDLLSATSVTYWDVVNFFDPGFGGGGGEYGDNNPYPLDSGGNQNEFAVLAEGILAIPVSGTYLFGFRGDDGGYLQIVGQTWEALVDSATGESVINGDRIECDCGTGNSRTTGRIFLNAGQYTVRTLVFDQGGDSYWEVFGGQEGTTMQLLQTNRPIPSEDFPGLPIVAANVATIPVVETSLTPAGDQLVVRWTAKTNLSYLVEASSNLVDWVEIAGPFSVTGEVGEAVVPLQEQGSLRVVEDE